MFTVKLLCKNTMKSLKIRRYNKNKIQIRNRSIKIDFHFKYIHLQLRAHFGRKGFEGGSFDYFSCSFLLFTYIKI